MRINAPAVGKLIRKISFRIAKVARFFETPNEDERFYKNLLDIVCFSGVYEPYTDRQVGNLAMRLFNLEPGTKEYELMDSMIGRLMRSPAGPISYGEDGKPMFNYVPVIRLIPAGMAKCDGCGSLDRPVDEARHNCLYCLGLAYSVEVRRDKLTNTLRIRTANIAKIVKDQLKEFQKSPQNSPEPPKAS